MAASDLVKFKRGTLQALESLITNNSGVDGTFYLTVDDDASGSNNPSKSSRLYVGRADGSIVPVNQGIITVTTVNDLTDGVNGKWHAGDYAYVTGTSANNYNDGNILAIYDGQHWKQINAVGSDTDTFIGLEQFSTATASGVTTVTLTGTYVSNVTGKNGNTISDAFTVEGANGITASSSGKAITLTGTSYEMGSDAASNNQAVIKLKSKASANATAADVDSVTITSANSNRIHITGAADTIEIDAPKVTSAVLSNETAGFGLVVTDTFGDSTTKSTVDPIITIKTSKDGTSKDSVHFVSGTADLDVYSTGVIDSLLQGLNALVYRGTVGTGGSYASSVGGITAEGMSGLQIGDTFKLTGSHSDEYSNIPVKAGNSITNTGTAHGGDLLIANGTETDGVITSLYYDIIEVEQGEDTTYSLTATAANNKVVINDSHGTEKGGIQIVAGNVAAVSSTASNGQLVTTIGHAQVNAAGSLDAQEKLTATPETAAVQGDNTDLTFTAVTGVTVDKFGHTTEVKTKEITVKDSKLGSISESFSASATSNVATITNTPEALNKNGDAATATAGSFKIESDNLTVTAPTPAVAGTPEVKINLMWESF